MVDAADRLADMTGLIPWALTGGQNVPNLEVFHVVVAVPEQS